VSQTQRVFVDANVLYSRTLRDWLFLLRNETSSSFQIHSTEDVLVETLYRLRRDHPKWDGGHISRLRKHLELNLDELIADYDMSVNYNGVDPNDLHVHAAAIAGHADILLTADEGFATLAERDTLPYSVYGCDAFFVLLDDSGSRAVQRVVSFQQKYWSKKRDSDPAVKSLSAALAAAGCKEFALRVEGHLKTLSGPTPQTHPQGGH